MEALSVGQTDTFVDKRNPNRINKNLWESLSLSQKFSTSGLTKFGYDIVFIRNQNTDNCLAILTCGGSVATVNAEGDVDSNPTIKIR